MTRWTELAHCPLSRCVSCKVLQLDKASAPHNTSCACGVRSVLSSSRMNSTKPQVGIAAAAVAFPPQRISSREVAQAESIDPAAVASLGIEEVPVCDEETASSLALSAAREALQRAGTEAALLDVIIDYS